MSLGEDWSQSSLEASDEASDARRLWLALVEQAACSDRLSADLTTMRGSLSWRITSPMRGLRAWLSRRPSGRPALQPGTTLPQGQVTSPEFAGCWHSQFERANDNRAHWFVDVTELSREDLGAGVERVTRRLLSELLLEPPAGARVQPVRLSPNGEYVCANVFLARFLGLPAGTFGADLSLRAGPGDQFIGLDFCRSHAALLRQALQSLRAKGVVVSLFVHDVLPLTNPDWFPSGVPEEFEAWLLVLAELGDRALCNSHHTAAELAAVLAREGIRVPDLRLDVIPLGANFPPAPHVDVLPPRTGAGTRVLTVGTVEPRKGHAQALDAFEALWARGDDVEWVIAGKPGWGVAPLVARIQSHPELGRRLRWLGGPDDRELVALYRECDILLAPSLGEGFGLPVAEAAWHGLPLILRDLPVFHEVVGDRASYFSSADPGSLERTLANRRQAAPTGRHVTGSLATWAQSAYRLKELCASGKDPHG